MASESDLSVSFIVTCKGRLHHIKQTLPLMVAQKPDEIIVVDYTCPDGVGDWVEANYDAVKVVRVPGKAGFNASAARNAGARKAASQWLCFIDADVKIRDGWVKWMRESVSGHCHFRASPKGGRQVRETWGTFICSREAFDAVEGYDEVFEGWGGEDTDIYRRLELCGFRHVEYPCVFVEPIRHSDEERFAFYDQKERYTHHLINRFYIEAKRNIIRFQMPRHGISLERRKALMNMIIRDLGKWEKSAVDDLPTISLVVDDYTWLPKPYRMHAKISISLNMAYADEESAGWWEPL